MRESTTHVLRTFRLFVPGFWAVALCELSQVPARIPRDGQRGRGKSARTLRTEAAADRESSRRDEQYCRPHQTRNRSRIVNDQDLVQAIRNHLEKARRNKDSLLIEYHGHITSHGC